jgi:hypothetical protein
MPGAELNFIFFAVTVQKVLSALHYNDFVSAQQTQWLPTGADLIFVFDKQPRHKPQTTEG